MQQCEAVAPSGERSRDDAEGRRLEVDGEGGRRQRVCSSHEEQADLPKGNGAWPAEDECCQCQQEARTGRLLRPTRRIPSASVARLQSGFAVPARLSCPLVILYPAALVPHPQPTFGAAMPVRASVSAVVLFECIVGS